jgi:1,4-alpha-glucan branching enzyme
VQPLKADPVGFGSQHPPENASVVRRYRRLRLADGDWMAARGGKNDRTAPISIYEVHLGSWKRKDGGRAISYGRRRRSWSTTSTTWASPISS